MTHTTDTAAGGSRDRLFSPPSLPKGGGTVAPDSGMLSIGGADGAAGWTLPLPLPAGRTLSPSLTLAYSSEGGNGAFGAGWQCNPASISRMTRLGAPRYNQSDRLLGADGEEILPDASGPRIEANLPFSTVPAEHRVTPWVRRSGGRDERLEHWCATTQTDSPGFWLQYHADGSITLFGWSPTARLADPQAPAHVACWYAEETVSATGEHVVYEYRKEDDANCEPAELSAHGQATGCYLSAVHAMNATPCDWLLIPQGAFRAQDFMTLMLFDYGERGTDVQTRPPFQATAPWPMREDCFSHWRWGFDQRVRRLCHDVLLWHRTGMMAGQTDTTAQLVSRLHLSYEQSGVTSLLLSAQQVAYEVDGEPLLLPPIEFELTRPGRDVSQWEAMPELDGFHAPRWQLADLYGEGVPGLLYLDNNAWWYRAPQRSQHDVIDAVTWDRPQMLPQTPSAQLGSGQLVDLDSSGRPQWLVNLPSMRGSFTLAPDGQWNHFISMDAMPGELAHGAAQLVDLSGDGCQDLVMVGPRSVRLYAKQRGAGWRAAQEVNHGSALPIVGGEDRMVAFADLTGSGLQQMLEITERGVRYWPAKGHGSFAEPVEMPGFAIEGFAASRVLLGDTDGSGTVDILYVQSDRVRVFVNQSGNRFVEGPCVMAPDGVVLDDTCKLQLADLRGQGSVELVLTQTHVQPRTWAYRFNGRRPWLLAEVCDNSGSRVLFDYRSSAQAWLDEKAELQGQGRPAVCHLPFPVHTLCQVTTLDEISGLRTVTGMRYQGGVWDCQEREFRGFTRLIQTDTLENAQGSAAERSPPAQVHHWFLSGSDAHDTDTPGAFSNPDSVESAFAIRALRFTQLQGGREVPFEPEGAARRWLLRALRGRSLRSETYGLDGSERASIPYAIERRRWQIRVHPTAHPDRPAALVTEVETLTFATERIAQDPVVTQRVILAQDSQGYVLQSADLYYPRQSQRGGSIYPDDLPEGLEAASRDPQQDKLWLTLSRTKVHNLEEGHCHVSGLAETVRTDVLALPATAIAQGGFDVEGLLAAEGPLASLGQATLTGYSRTRWCDAQGALCDLPVRQALVAFTETALLDEAALDVLRDNLPSQGVGDWLEACGYHPVTLPEDGAQVHVGRHDLARYYGPEMFYRFSGTRESEMMGQGQVEWSPHAVAITRITDAAGLQSAVRYDWRFMTPVSITDANSNVQQVGLDALGRVVESRMHGSENGVATGYGSQSFSLPQTVEAMLALRGGDVPVATAHRQVTDSWMPWARDRDGRVLPTRMGELALRRHLQRHGLPAPNLAEERQPTHVITLQTDRYDGDPQQQVRLSISHGDGAGRALQSAVLSAPGEALVRTSEGRLQTDAQGKAVFAHAPVRWAVSGKTEYDNKGQPVRTWLPYYLNDWRLVRDDTAREGLYADTHLYDALGRVIRVVTAAGKERRTQFYPWFTVSEDENDTVQ
ncbi:SpvB/TcaC N-terminal domain-containing protein [Pseudomonas putida]|uniref:SpvB/TcaC N-terminal domain-containing protein n=1 Tax=Pseudomonas putida TaxID=303 RepID=UPI0037C88DC2